MTRAAIPRNTMALLAAAMSSAAPPAEARQREPDGTSQATATPPVPAMLPMAVQFDMTSRNTGRTYRIYVSRPARPAPVAGYPTLYVLDADATFPTAASQAALALLDDRPPLLVVGIGYPDAMAALSLRNRDLTPYKPVGATAVGLPDALDNYGGGDAFHRFMVEELRPVIGTMAAVNAANHSLMGYSLDGLFVLHVLLTSPEAYRNYVIGSPSVWWNDREVLKDWPSFSRKVEAGAVAPRVLVTSDELEQAPPGGSAGSGDVLPDRYRMVDNARKVADRLRALKGRPGYRVDYVLFAGETHNSGVPASTSRGVAFVGGAAERRP